MNQLGLPHDPDVWANFAKIGLVLLYTTPLAPIIFFFFDWMLT